MKLHEAIEHVLREEKNPLPAKEIATRINLSSLYNRGDGKPVPGGQVSARVNNYPRLFYKENGLVHLLNWESTNRGFSDEKDPPKLVDETSQFIGSPVISEFLIHNKFKLLGTIESLIKEKLPKSEDINNCGIYAISIAQTTKPNFKPGEECLNVISPWSIEDLESKWVRGSDVIYYGLAGRDRPRSLRKRLNDLLRHAKGDITASGPHKGGEIIWQIEGFEKFNVWILSTADPPTPIILEKSILNLFKSHCGSLPFGNRRI